MNSDGPMVSSIYNWRKKHTVLWSRTCIRTNVVAAREILKNAISSLNINGPLVAELSEDETSLLTYSQKSDELLGSCGESGENHVCTQSFSSIAGNGEKGYDHIVNAFQILVVPTYAKVIILNILHPKLPKLPILLMPTCNKFDNAFIRRQWSEIFEICSEELKGLVIVIGNASDGDSRRRKCQLDDLTCTEKDRSRFRSISACLGFHLCAKVIASPDIDGTFIISNLGDQDGIHNHKN